MVIFICLVIPSFVILRAAALRRLNRPANLQHPASVLFPRRRSSLRHAPSGDARHPRRAIFEPH
ncbi:MAG: hypothetical protein ACN6PY_09615, partial [Paraburkholderia nemoris]